MLLDITPLNEAVRTYSHISTGTIAIIYVCCTMAISKLYVVQAYKFLRGENGAGDYCFTTKIGQALLRLAGLVYATYINDGTVFLVIALDFAGRWAEIIAAYVARQRFGNTISLTNPIASTDWKKRFVKKNSSVLMGIAVAGLTGGILLGNSLVWPPGTDKGSHQTQNQQHRDNRQGGCNVSINGASTHLNIGEKTELNGRTARCEAYDGHPVLVYAELKSLSR
jgi:hypothetical protein